MNYDRAVIAAQILTLMDCYPKIYFACHTRHVRDEQTDQRLSAHQASILDHLDEVEPIGLLALAGHMGVTASTMSLTIDRLVRAGYVSRDRDAVDARRVAMRLTKDGARVKERKSVLDRALVAAMLGRMKPKERAAGLAGLEMLAKAAGEFIESRRFKELTGRVA
jgi:MarR family transcriptional regulator, organic hydroperoxide resistance regulator